MLFPLKQQIIPNISMDVAEKKRLKARPGPKLGSKLGSKLERGPERPERLERGSERSERESKRSELAPEYYLAPTFGEMKTFLETYPKRWIDINSSKRERSLYPNPCNFVSPYLLYEETIRAPVMYNVRLAMLAIPNVEVLGGMGGTPGTYPYLYVLFRPVGITEKSDTKLWSNNNFNLRGAFFKVPYDDLRTVIIPTATFATLENCRMVQTMLMSPSDKFQVTLIYPMGGVVTFSTADTVPPTAPNPLLQISLSLEIQRVG